MSRFSYNWGLVNWGLQYQQHKENKANPIPTQFSLRKQLNSIKRKQFPWMLEVTKNAPQMALIHLGRAFNNFFAGRAKYPKFHRKGINDFKIRVPHIGWVRMTDSLNFDGKIISATVSRVADKWFVSITVDIPENKHLPKKKQS